MFRRKKNRNLYHDKGYNKGLEELNKIDTALSRQIQSRSHKLIQNLTTLPEGWHKDFKHDANVLFVLGKGLESNRKVIAELLSAEIEDPSDADITHVTSSYFLSREFEYLSADPHKYERLSLITGVESNGKRYLTQSLRVTMEDQSSGFVKTDDNSAAYTPHELYEKFGHKLLGWFHIHPGSSTTPSSIDTKTHNDFYKRGLKPLAAIFSREGEIRFFSQEDFKLHIYGTGIKQLKDAPREKVYKLTKGAS